ncbi:MAG TPA: hypothetical protein VNE39_11075, partial [Planctomycetota bacterium]|nr:hypothetical protein [Planctomycetota bacterium]
MKLTVPKRIGIHTLLIVGSCLFIFPFIWLVTTSLKPVEQIMKMPPDWLPRAYYAPVEGQRLKVVKEREIGEPSLIVRYTVGGTSPSRVLLPAAKYADGKAEIEVRVADRTEVVRVPATVEKQVPKGWWLVREKIERLPQDPGPAARWDCAAPDQVQE